MTLSLSAQEIVIKPDNITMEVGDKLTVEAYVVKDGKKQDIPVRLFSRARKSLFIDSTLTATAYKPGVYDVIALAQGAGRTTFQVNVSYPPITEVNIKDVPEKIYSGTPVSLKYKVLDKAGLVRDDVAVSFSSSNESVASISAFGVINSIGTGKVTITAQAEEITNTVNINVVKNPIETIELTVDGDQARTGDVFHFRARALNNKGNEVFEDFCR